MNKKARIISLVPSWTETALVAGIHVVGCTYFCIHPSDKISSIPKVGGTKSMNLEKILGLKPDYVILDEQENKLEMAQQLSKNNIQLLVSNVIGLQTAQEFLGLIGQILENDALLKMSERFRHLLNSPSKIDQDLFWRQIYLRGGTDFKSREVEYVIWKKPFMVVGKNTFIAENLALAGIHLVRGEKYPVVSEADLKKSFCLFASEPYPFEKEFDHLLQSGFSGALIDGEKLSWYGIRNLTFLEQCLK